MNFGFENKRWECQLFIIVISKKRFLKTSFYSQRDGSARFSSPCILLASSGNMWDVKEFRAKFLDVTLSRSYIPTLQQRFFGLQRTNTGMVREWSVFCWFHDRNFDNIRKALLMNFLLLIRTCATKKAKSII